MKKITTVKHANINLKKSSLEMFVTAPYVAKPLLVPTDVELVLRFCT